MPEPSDSDRRKAAQLSPDVAATLLIDCVELGYDVWFKCQYCGMERTWGRREMLSRRLRKYLAWPMDKVQRAVVCPVRGCGGPLPVLRVLKGGYAGRCSRRSQVQISGPTTTARSSCCQPSEDVIGWT